MLFSSLEFLLMFLPVTAIIYFILPRAAENYWLLLASLFFYAWGEPKFVLVMIASIVFNYIAAILVEKRDAGSAGRKLILILAVMFDLGLLFAFKYLNFITGILNGFSPEIKVTQIALPVGISFFTFQAMSYVIDVYRGIPAQRNICNLGLYISFFPQLIAGPIVRYTTVMEQINDRQVTAEDFSSGLKRFMTGFNKKILLANIMAEAADAAFGMEAVSCQMAWLGIVCYDLQIFFDFCGYSDMAIGLGRMFGFHFLENFDYPYISKSLTEFWRRWHISLGSWFRDYVYFPLGGSRVSSKLRLAFNLALVWLLTGIWHGADYTFILWGVLHGAFVIAEKLLDIPRKTGESAAFGALGRTVTLLVVTLGWVLFRAESTGAAISYIGTMFSFGSLSADPRFDFYFREYALMLLAAILCATPVFRRFAGHFTAAGGKKAAAYTLCSWLIQLLLFAFSISFLVMDSYNPFIYFNF